MRRLSWGTLERPLQGESGSALPNSRCNVAWVEVGPLRHPTQANPTPSALLYVCFSAVKRGDPFYLPSAPPPLLKMDRNQPTLPRGFLPNPVLGERADVMGFVLALPSSLPAPCPTKSGLFPPHSHPQVTSATKDTYQPLQTTSFLPSSGLSFPQHPCPLMEKGC